MPHLILKLKDIISDVRSLILKLKDIISDVRSVSAELRDIPDLVQQPGADLAVCVARDSQGEDGDVYINELINYINDI